jgi:hypothetical protein
MKKIEMGKKYSCEGVKGVVRYTDGKRPGYPVLFETHIGNLYQCDEYGRSYSGGKLTEISPYADIPIDTPGWARMDWTWNPRYFAGVDADGRPMAWLDGTTSFSSGGKKISWDEFTTTKPEGVV